MQSSHGKHKVYLKSQALIKRLSIEQSSLSRFDSKSESLVRIKVRLAAAISSHYSRAKLHWLRNSPRAQANEDGNSH